MSINLKKFFHKYQFLKLELDETEEEIHNCLAEFNKIFGKYIVDKNSEVWINEETGEIRQDKPDNVETKKGDKKPEKLKKLYKELSKFTHPDKGGTSEDFNDIKSAYENNNLLELVFYAGKYDINIDIEDNDLTLLNQSCDNMEKKIENYKSTPAWNFYNGTKNQRIGILKMMEQSLNIQIPKEEYPDFLLEDD